jgi:quercetin dioxygenase-like cupin family protein
MKFTDIKAEELKPDFGVKSTIRWLITDADGARASAMRYFQIMPGGKIFPHHHPWEHEIFIVKGEGKLRIGRRWYSVSEGTFIFIPPNVEHEYVNSSDQPFEFICVIPLKPTAEDKLVEC